MTLYLQTRDSLPLQIHASTLPLITKYKVPFEIDKIREKFPCLKSQQYTDTQPDLPLTLLIGNDHMWPLVKSVENLEKDIYIIHTCFGFTVAGKGLLPLIPTTARTHTAIPAEIQNLWNLRDYRYEDERFG